MVVEERRALGLPYCTLMADYVQAVATKEGWSQTAIMAKRKPKLPTLTDRGNQIVAAVVNAVAFQTHGDDAELDTLAKTLGTTGPRLRPMLRKLEAQGWLTVEDKSLTFVYPTAAALRWVDPKLSEPQSLAIVRRLKGRTSR
jgi:hypothetical protein